MSVTVSNTFRWDWGTALWTFVQLWERDKVAILLFFGVNILVGQIGVCTSLAVSFENGQSLADAWLSNIKTAALYTFSISLLASSLALIAWETIDGIRSSEPIKLFEYKAFWGVVAFTILALQAPMAGNLASESAVNVSQPHTAVERQESTASPVAVATVNSSATGLSTTADSKRGSTSTSTTKSATIQVLFWVMSMVASFQIFCLNRLHLTPENFAARWTDEVNDQAKSAEKKTKTKFDEEV
jgi:hypothetical protein